MLHFSSKSIIMKKDIILIIFSLLAILVHAQTIIPAGNVSGNWTKANSPYQIKGDLIVPANQTLNIEPGVKVEFQGWYEIKVYGRMQALGTENNMINFTTNDTTGFYSSEKGWRGIRFLYNQQKDTSSLEYCNLDYVRVQSDSSAVVFANAYNFLQIENCKFSNTISDYYIYGSNYGDVIKSLHSSISLHYCNLTYNKVNPTMLLDSKQVSLIGNHIFNNNGETFLQANEKLKVVNNIICNNSFGLEISTNMENGNTIIACNTISNNNLSQLYLDGKIYLLNNIITECQTELSKNSIYIYQNKSGFLSCNINVDTIVGTPIVYQNIIEGDPMFVNPTLGNGVEFDATKADWSLMSESPCIDAGISPDSLNLPEFDIKGNPRIYNGTIDIGAIEYNDTITSLTTTLSEAGDFVIFPNPSGSDFTIHGEGINGEVLIEIVSISGNLIYSEKIYSGGDVNRRINVKNLERGVYIVNIISGGKRLSEKLVFSN